MANKEPSTTETPSFTQSFKALDGILEQFKKGSPSLEEALTLFEQGVGHIKICQETLGKARGRVEELVQNLQDGGEIVTRPFEE